MSNRLIILDFVGEDGESCGSTTIRKDKFSMEDIKVGSSVQNIVILSHKKEIKGDEYIVVKSEQIPDREPTRYRVYVKRGN